MKIVNKRKFIRTISILITLVCLLIAFSKITYSKVEVSYEENYIYRGDTLWSIAKQQVEENNYFEDKDIRDVISELKEINNLQDSNLTEGNKIKIPVFK